MLKRFAVLTMSLTVGAVAFGAAACENTSESVFPAGGQDAAADSGPGFTSEPKDGEDASKPVDCTPSASSFTPTWKAPTKGSACSADLLREYYDTCVNPGPDAGANPAQQCTSWLAAHGDCAKCLEPGDNTGPIQFHRDRFYYTLNVAGCLAIERSEPEAGKCPATYSASIECQRKACDGCLLQNAAEFADFQKCQGTARTTDCKTYEDKIGQVCGTEFNDPDGGAYDCFRPSGDKDERTHFVRVEGIFCGP